MSKTQLWPEATFVAIDLETTGKYPLDAEICEMAAVKWSQGQVVDTFQTLIKPRVRMGAEVIAIHNITNEMVEDAPRLEDQLALFHKFICDDIVIAHHAPFDMGFLAWEMEKARLPLPTRPVICTSLLSRAVNFKVANHRLATLVEYFNLDAGSAHRALDDSRACLGVALKYFAAMGAEAQVEEILHRQGPQLAWSRFSIEELMEREHLRLLIRALRDKFEVLITYRGGSRPGQARRVYPMGLVRSLDGDFLVATEGSPDDDDIKPKRYFIDKISDVQSSALF